MRKQPMIPFWMKFNKNKNKKVKRIFFLLLLFLQITPPWRNP